MGKGFSRSQSHTSQYSSERVVILVSILEIFEYKMRAFGQTIYKSGTPLN